MSYPYGPEGPGPEATPPHVGPAGWDPYQQPQAPGPVPPVQPQPWGQQPQPGAPFPQQYPQQPTQGMPQQDPYYPGYPAPGTQMKPPADPFAITALVTGICFLVLPLGLLGVIPIVMGILALNRISVSGRGGKGLAIGGIATGGVALLSALSSLLAFSSPFGIFSWF